MVGAPSSFPLPGPRRRPADLAPDPLGVARADAVGQALGQGHLDANVAVSQGNRKPSTAALLAICRALDVDPRVFADCDDLKIEPKPPPTPKNRGKAGRTPRREG
jgi:hypothetical protein